MCPRHASRTPLNRLPLLHLPRQSFPNENAQSSACKHPHNHPKDADIEDKKPLLRTMNRKNKEDITQKYTWDVPARNASEPRRCSASKLGPKRIADTETYEVDSTFDGFKLILVRVRASGIGML